MNSNSLPTQKLKIVVLGGTGLIGRQLIPLLRARGHTATAASLSSGVNAVTGAGLAAALAGADVVVDVSNSPSFAPQAVMNFFVSSTRNLVAAAAAAGARHLVALSVVGTDRGPDNAYFLAKLAQEGLLAAGPVPYTIVRATQFFEFTPAIAQVATVDQTVRVPAALMQPIASADVAALLADAVLAGPRNGLVEIAGPEQIRQDELVRRFLAASGDNRTVATDPQAGYFGAAINDQSLMPSAAPRTGTIRFGDWLRQAYPQN